MKEIRLLTAEEIDVRVGSIYKSGITLLLYKDARVDMSILDSTYGPMGWKRRHFMQGDAMFCEVSIQNPESGEWISKTDVGAPSYSEPLKGAASDAFKRACTNVGIGRELYTAPFIWIPIEKVGLKENQGKQAVKDKFKVQTISYDEKRRTITGLVIANQKQEVVFQYMDYQKPKAVVTITAEQEAVLLGELKRTGVALTAVLRKHKLKTLSEMSPELWRSAMEALQQTQNKAA